MRKQTIVSLAFVLAACGGSPSNSQKIEMPKVSPENQSIIEQIHDDYVSIENNISMFTTLEKEIKGISTKGGFATYYLDGEDVQRMDIQIFGETAKSEAEYYLKNNKPFFVHNIGTFYTYPMSNEKFSEDDAKIVDRKIYLSEGKVISLIEDGGTIISPDIFRSTASAVKVISEAALQELEHE